jgi:hypothetical protein
MHNSIVKALLVVSFLSLPDITGAQSRIKEVLRAGDTTTLHNFLQNPLLQFITAPIYREIIPGYYEKSFTIGEKSDNARIIEHNVDLLIHAGKIVCWYTDKPFEKMYIATDIDSFFDQSSFNRFETAFTNKYGRPLNRNDLFAHTVFSVYLC